jgi:DME family drug/metabolite transporter
MCAAALWATVGVVTELVPQHAALPRDAYGLMRTLVAAPAILLLAALSGGRAGLKTHTGSAPEFLKFGVYCAVFQWCLFRSFDLLGVTITVFLTVCLPPLIAIGWAALRGTERLSAHVILAFLLGAAGLLAFVSADGAGGGAGHVLPGLALSLAASVAFVLMTQSGRRLAVRHSPLLIAGLGLLVTAGVLLPVALLSSGLDVQPFSAALGSWQGAGAVLYLGLVPTALAYVCYCSGMARCRSATAGLVASMIEPAVAACLAFFLLHEALTPWQLAGCGVMMAAMLLLGRSEARARPLFRTAEPQPRRECETA